MLKYELKILFKERINKILILILMIIAITFSCFAICSIKYVDKKGNTDNGFLASRRLTESKSKYTGPLTPEIIQTVANKQRQITKKYGNKIPEKIYSTGPQEYGDIVDLCISILCYNKEFNESELEKLNIKDFNKIYEIRDKNLVHEIKEYGTTHIKALYLEEQYSKISIPFYYEPAESWKTMGLYATTYAMILLIAVSFLSAGIFSREFKLQSNSIFFSTKHGRSRGTITKIASGIIMTTLLYWTGMLTLSAMSLGIMGFSGAKSPIQIEYSYCVYAYSFIQRYLLILFAGYIANLLASVLSMLISAKYHSSLLSICFPFIIFIVSPFLERVVPFKQFFQLMPAHLLNVYNDIKLTILYQFGNLVLLQIPFTILLYLLITVILVPLIYIEFSKYYDK